MKQKMKAVKYAAVIVMLLTAATAHSQAIDQLGFKKGVQVNGSIGASATAYTAHGIASRRDPFAWYLNGNLNLVLFGYSMPFSFSYSNQSRTYAQPFNQFRFAPSYKWAKAYIGTSSMTFSNYTLAGHMFNGVGVELNPNKWRIAAMYGTLQKAVPFDITNPDSYNRAAYERKGYGCKIGYDNNGNTYGVAIFSAKDDPASLPFIPDDATIGPQKNVAVAFTVKQNITKSIFADAEYSLSALNRDIRSEKAVVQTIASSSNLLGKLLSPTTTTNYFDAIQAGLGYRGRFYSVQLRYERVAPGYTTLGAYNVVNDMRNMTIAPTVQLFSGKVNLAANVGIQKNNLDQTKASTTKRWVGSLNANIVPGEHWIINGGYSNFSNYTKIRPLADPYFNNPLDTLNYYQVNNTYNAMVTYRTGDKTVQRAITFNTSYQYANDHSSDQNAQANLSKFFTSNIAYSYNLEPKALSITGSLNYYANNATGINTTFVGPSVNVNKQYFEKTLRTGITTTYNITNAKSVVAGTTNSTKSSVFNMALNVNYSPKGGQKENGNSPHKRIINKGKHNIGGSVMWLAKGRSASMPGYTELTTTVNYSYAF